MRNSLFKSAFRNLAANRIRTILIISGFIIALICLTVSQYLSNLIDLTKEISLFNTSGAIVTITANENRLTMSEAKKIGNLYEDAVYNAFSSIAKDSIIVDDEKVNFTVTGITFINDNMTIPSCERAGAVEETSIIAGRNITNSDVSLGRKVVLINECVATCLYFDVEAALNQKIKLSGVEYTVVGILSDTPDMKRMMSNAKSYYEQGRGDMINFPVYTYCLGSNKIDTVLLFFEGDIDNDGLKFIRSSLGENGFSSISVTSAIEQSEILRASSRQETKIIQLILTIVTIIMCVASLIVIFFSIKERAFEIAIRKSVGATSFQIVTMILFEIILCLMIAIIYSVPLSFFIMVGISAFVEKIVAIYLFPFSVTVFILPILIITLAISVVSVIPTLIFSKSKIVNSLKVS